MSTYGVHKRCWSALTLGCVLVGLGCSDGSGPPVAPRDEPKPSSDAGYTAAGQIRVPRPPYELLPVERVAAIADEPGPDELTLVFVGDIMLGHHDRLYLQKYGQSYPFEGTAPLLQKADLTIGNLEGPIADVAATTKGRASQRMPSSGVEGLVWAGIDAVSLANNHVHDTGDEGVRETIAHLEQAGIGWFGAGGDERQAREPWITEVRGMRIAVLGGVSTGMLLHEDWIRDRKMIEHRRGVILDDLTHAGGAIEMGTFLYTPDTLAQSVAAARRVADLVVVNLHMGVIHYRPPYVDQVRLARAAAEAGADLVIGHHAHFWQPVAIFSGMPVVFGLGNYTFGYVGARADESLIARAVVSTASRRITRVELFPIATSMGDPQVEFRPRLLAGESARIALEDLGAWSESLFHALLEIREDRAVLRPPD